MSDTVFTFDDFADACDAARELNEWVPPERTRTAAPCPSGVKGDRPGDDYNRRAEWSDILRPHGWQVDRTSGEVTYWTRPGKDRGVSATTGKCKSEGGGDLLYVFSSNAAPFDPDTAYDKFGALAQLEHGGDFASAGRKLWADGYGRPDPAAVFTGSAGEGKPTGIDPDPDFATNDDLRALDLDVRWAWPQWLQMGAVNLLAAEGGAGKTRFMADLCRRINSGEPWPDGSPATPWDSQYLAMWVAGDRNHGELLTLSESFGFGERIAYSGSKADPLGGITLQGQPDFRALARRVAAARPLFLVIDTAGGATPFNLAKQEEARAFFGPLSDIAVRLAVCVVVITHLNATKKVLGKRAEERVRCVIRMSSENREPETVRRLEVVKSNSLFPRPIGMRLGEHGNEYTADAPAAPEEMPGAGSAADSPDRGPPTKVRECMDWLAAILKDRPMKVGAVRDLAEHAGFSAPVLYKAKTALSLAEVESGGAKYWGLRK